MANYHEQSSKAFGGAKKSSLDEEGSSSVTFLMFKSLCCSALYPQCIGKYLHSSIRASTLSAVDELVRNVANLYISNR